MIVDRFGDLDAVLVVDETSDLKGVTPSECNASTLLVLDLRTPEVPPGLLHALPSR